MQLSIFALQLHKQESTMNKQETTIEYPYCVEYLQGGDVLHEEPYTARPMVKQILDGAETVHGGTSRIDSIRLMYQPIGEYERCVSAWTRHDKGHWVGVPPTAEDQEPVETASPAPDIVKAAPPAEPPARKDKEVFRDVAMYRTSPLMGNVTRQDCKEVTVQYGVKYAQYDNAVQVSYLEKGKRKARGFMVDSHPFLVLVPVKEAVEPDSMYGEPTKSESGAMVSEGRYHSFDERWTSDFMTKLEALGATVLLDLSGLNPYTGEMKEHQEPVVETEPEVIEEPATAEEEPPAPACAHKRIMATVGKGFTCRDCHAQV